VILDALARFDRRIIFIDADTWFAAHPAKLISRVGPGRALFHICESFVAKSGTVVTRALARQLEQVPLALRSGEKVVLGPRTKMWNTGVVGVDPADRERMFDALALSDEIWRTADPAGAFGQKIHVSEQFATSYALRNCRIREAADCIHHYWRPKGKHSFGAIIPGLVNDWMDDPRPATLARAYAARYRETGLRARADATAMALRGLALKLGLPTTGTRRSV